VDLPDELRSATCSFCDSALVAEADGDAEAVDRVVPFEVPRERASTTLGAHLAAHWLAPEVLRRAARPDELRQVFVPFYVFDAVARTTFSVQIGNHWYRTETYTTTVNGKRVTRTRRVRETEWSSLEGSHVRQWFQHLVSASRGLVEGEANALEPFDLGRSVPFVPAVVAGVAAERATVPHAAAARVASQELADLEAAVIAREHLPGDTHRNLSSRTTSDLSPPGLALLPVWIGVVKGPKGPLRLLVNGQTGEAVGRVPRSPFKIALLVASVLGALGLVVLIVMGAS